MSDRFDPALTVASRALASAAGAAAGDLSVRLLSSVISVAISGPVGAALSEIVKALVSALLSATESLDKKIDLILAEPLRNAVTSLNAILSVDIRTREEEIERDRQLQETFYNLKKAYVYVGQDRNGERRHVVRLYQCIVAALMPGGRPFAELWIAELRNTSVAARLRASIWKNEAQAVDLEIAPENIEAMVDSWQGYPDGALYGPGALSGYLSAAEDRKRAALETAEFLEKSAADMDLFCDWVLYLAANRDELLGRRGN